MAALLPVLPAFSQAHDYGHYAVQNELNPGLYKMLRAHCQEQGLPLYVICEKSGTFSAIAFEQGTVLYAQLVNPAKPDENTPVVTAEKMKETYSPENYRAVFADGHTEGNLLPAKISNTSGSKGMEKVLLIPNSGLDRIMLFDAFSGDSITTNFYSSNPAFNTQIDTDLLPDGRLIASDQTSDVLHVFSALQNGNTVFAPAGGVNNAIMDNIRGMAVTDSGSILVTSASGTNINTIVIFDTAGQYTGLFAPINQCLSPFDVLIRSSDVLVTEINGNNVRRYAFNGNLLGVFKDSVTFGEQMYQAPNGDIYTANFQSGEPGIIIQQANGTLIRKLSCISGTRGVYLLGNGNLLATNSLGVYEIDKVADTIIRTVVSGINGRYITEVPVNKIQWPEITVLTTPSTMLCGDTIFAEGLSNPALTFSWLRDGLLVSTGYDTLNITQSGHYDLVVQYLNVWSDTIPFTITDAYDSLTIDQSGANLSVPDVYLSYQWYFNGTLIPSANTDQYTAVNTGWYMVEVSASPTCTIFSDSVYVTIAGYRIDQSSGIRLYPNPAEDYILIEFPESYNNTISLILTEITGRCVREYHLNTLQEGHTHSLDLKGIEPGLYLLRRSDNDRGGPVGKIMIK